MAGKGEALEFELVYVYKHAMFGRKNVPVPEEKLETLENEEDADSGKKYFSVATKRPGVRLPVVRIPSDLIIGS